MSTKTVNSRSLYFYFSPRLLARPTNDSHRLKSHYQIRRATMRPSQAHSPDSNVRLCKDDPESTSEYGLDPRLSESHSSRQQSSSEGIDYLNGLTSISTDSSRITRSSYYDDWHCFQRPRYRAYSVLRPLISQDGGAETSSSPSSARVASSESRLCYDGDTDCERASDLSAHSEDFPTNRAVRRRPVSTISAASVDATRHRFRYGSRSPSSWSWFRITAVTLLVIFSFAALFDVGRCQSVLVDGPKGSTTSPLANSTSLPSGVNASRILPGDRRDQHNRNDRHGRSRPRGRHPNSGEPNGGNWVDNGHDEDEEERQQKLSKAAFRQLSRMAFKALISEDYQDRPLRPPDEDGLGGPLGTDDAELTVEGRRQIRRQHRKLQRQRQKQLRRQQLARRLDDEDQANGEGGDLLPPASDYNQRELVDQQDESSSADQNENRLPGRRRAIAIATKDSIKPDSCRTVPLKQRVRMTGCATKIVVNHFCYGQCNSFYIPKLSKKRLRAAFESCSVCRPKTYVPVSVTLHCPSRNPPYVKRKIMKVKDCSCMPANVSDNDIPQP